MIDTEPIELSNYDSFIEKSPTFQKYKSRNGLESGHFSYMNEVYSATVFNQCGNIDVFTHNLSTGVTGMSGESKLPRNPVEQKCDYLANWILRKIVNESQQLYKEMLENQR